MFIKIAPIKPKNTNTIVGLYTVTDRTTIDGSRSQVATQVVVGYGVTDHKDLTDTVLEAVTRLGNEYMNNTTEEEKERKINELRGLNDANTTVSYSRQCHICCSPNPATRAVLTACGHSLCMACVLTLSKKGRLLCPFCRKSTAYVKLHEDIAEEREEREEKEKEKKKEEEKELEREADTVQERLAELAINAPPVDGIPVSLPSPSHTDPPPPAEVGENLNSRSIAATLVTNIRRFVPRFRPIRSSSTPPSSRSTPIPSQNTAPTTSAHTLGVTNLSPPDAPTSDLRILFSEHPRMTNIRLAPYIPSYRQDI